MRGRIAGLLAALAALAVVNQTAVAYAATNIGPNAPPKARVTATGRLNLFDPHSQQPSDNRQPLIVPAPSLSAHPSAPVSLSRNTPMPMSPGRVTLDPTGGGAFTGSDGVLDVTIPPGAVTASDLAVAGGSVSLAVRQIAPASGGNAGGSGHYSFGSYLLQVVGADGRLTGSGLRQPVRVTLHYGSREAALDTKNAYLLLNGPLPSATNLNPDPKGLALSAKAAGLGASSTPPVTSDSRARTLSASVSLTGSTTAASFNTDAPVATFGKPDPFNTDLSAGGLTATIPLDLPPGPDGLVPPLVLQYSSASVNEQHNVQGAAGWVGEGWNLSLGSITWAEHNVAGSGATNWVDSWQLNDAFGTAAELIPPSTNVSTYYDDTGNLITQSPIYWRTAPESHTHIYSFVGPVTPAGMSTPAPCFRVYLPSGIMEEFGCTADSLQYYPQPSGTPHSGTQYISSWNLDLITDRHGDQIHIGYQQDLESANGRTYPRDAVPQYIQWDWPACRNGDTECPQSSSQWQPLIELAFVVDYKPSRLTGQSCPVNGSLRCDDPIDLTSTGGLPNPEVQSTLVLNDVLVHVRSNGSAPWNTLRDYQFSYDQTPHGQITDPATGKSESTAGKLVLTKLTEVGDDGATALPTRSFSYSHQTQYYEDDANHAITNCGTFLPPGYNPNCYLWSISYEGNSYYLSTADNGMGLTRSFSWANGRDNAQGVASGNIWDPLACNDGSGNPISTSPCNLADDQQWGRTVLTQDQGQVYQASTAGSSPVTSGNLYQYILTNPLPAQVCQTCNFPGMYWGNRNDNDANDFYNGKFMGFAQATVQNPDLTKRETHYFQSTMGWGTYTAMTSTSSPQCWATNGYCAAAPWWDARNAEHGHELEADYFDANGTTLLKQVKTQYALTCPPGGAVGSPPVSPYNWGGQVVSELDTSNPVAVCDLHVSSTDTFSWDGASSGTPVPHQTVSYTYDGDHTFYGRETSRTLTSNDGTSGSPQTIVHKTGYIWNDNLSPQSTSVTGVFLTTPIAFSDTEDASGNQSDCSYNSYDGQPWQINANTSSVVLVDSTEIDRSTSCGNTVAKPTGKGVALTVTHTYDFWGNQLTTVDADGHAGCTGPDGIHLYSECRTFDDKFEVFTVKKTNAKNFSEFTCWIGPEASSCPTTPGAATGYGLWPAWKTDVNGQQTTFAYDALGRPLSETLPNESSAVTTSSFAYINQCQPTGAQTPCIEVDYTQRLNGTTANTSRAFYDGWGNPVEARTPGPSGQDVVRYQNYDKFHRMVFESVSYFVTAYAGSPPLAFSVPDSTQPGTSFTYDGIGRLLQTTDPLSKTTTNAISAVCNAPGTYDSACYEQTLTVDPLGHQGGGLVDAFGRKAYVQRFSGNSASTYALYATSAYQYDPNGSLTQVRHPDGVNTTSFYYDTAGRKTKMVDPDTGTSTYVYDPDANVLMAVDARGTLGTVYAGYDILDRPIWRSTTNTGTPPPYVNLSYDDVTSGNMGHGRLTSETFNGAPNNTLTGSYSYSYDARGQLTSSTLSLGSHSYSVQNTYDDAGNRLTQTYQNGDVVTTGYTPQGWLNSVSSQSSGGVNTSLLSNAAYAYSLSGQFGGPVQQITSASLGGGLYTYSATFDPLLRPSDIKVVGGSTTYFEQARRFDAAHNVTTATTTFPGGTDNQAFCYDEQDRLTWAGNTGTPPCGGTIPTNTLSNDATYAQIFAYDNLGRLTSGPLGSYVYGSSTHLHGVTSIGNAYTATYDLAGDIICRAPTSATTCAGTPTGAQLGYDNEGVLAKWQNAPSSPTATATYLYDGQGNRVEQQVTSGGVTTTTDYVGNVEEATYVTGGTTTITTFYYAGAARIAVAVNGNFSVVASDGLASANVALASGTASLTAAVLYGPYGGTRYSSGTMPMDYGFTGQHQDITSGLSYFNARYYDPVAGQFITPDTTLPGNGFDIFGLSRYAYVEGNPESRTDPTGRCPWCIGAVVGAVVGAGIAYGTQVVGNLQHNQGWGSLTHVDVKQIGKAALVGFVIGGTGGAAAGWLAASGVGTLATAAGTMGIGAGEGVLGQVGDNLLNGRTWHQDLSQAAVFGAATAGVGGAAGLGAGKLIKRFASKVVNEGHVPQGLTADQFASVSSKLTSGTEHIGGDLGVQGSRAGYTAGPHSDIDFAVRLDQESFAQFVEERFGTPTAAGDIESKALALERGRVFAGEAGLSPLRRSIQAELGIETDLSVIAEGGLFDNGPWIRILR
jgi:RHS repeat-associated protein